MKTVIQKIGPLYGDVINGSVFGQPNGSEAIPPVNILRPLNINSDYAYIKKNGTNGVISCKSDGTISSGGEYISFQVASQLPLTDVLFITEIADSSDFSNILVTGTASLPTSLKGAIIIAPATGQTAFITAGTTYHVRFKMCMRDGLSVMYTSATYEVEGVVV